MRRNIVAGLPASSNRSRDLVWNGIVNHVSNTGNQPKDAVRNFLVKPNGLAVLYGTRLSDCERSAPRHMSRVVPELD